MNRKHIIIIFALFLLFLTTSCSKEKPIEIVEEPTPPIEEPIEEEPIEEEPVVEEPDGVRSPLSGIYADEEIVNGRIMTVVFDNHPAARWQAGLKDAEVVFEFQVEAPYTRYVGLYLINAPESIGPVRSARPYLVEIAQEFDGIFVHVGGSEQAKKDARTYNIAEIDGLTSPASVFWRNSSKKAPNNLYTNMEVLRESAKNKKFRETSEYNGYVFAEEGYTYSGDDARLVEIKYNSTNTTKYEYDEEKEEYIRYKDGKLHIDESDDSSIVAHNIIIQKTTTRVLDNVGRIEVKTIGSGEGVFITKGVALPIKWVKESRDDRTYFYDVEGNEILLSPGVTWIQVINQNSSINIQ